MGYGVRGRDTLTHAAYAFVQAVIFLVLMLYLFIQLSIATRQLDTTQNVSWYRNRYKLTGLWVQVLKIQISTVRG
jgi:hypothetical protein